MGKKLKTLCFLTAVTLLALSANAQSNGANTFKGATANLKMYKALFIIDRVERKENERHFKKHKELDGRSAT